MDTSDNPVPVQKTDSIGLAVASLVLGIISIAFSLFVVGGLLAVIGIILGWVHLGKRKAYRAMAIWGIVLSVVGLLISTGLVYSYYQGYKMYQAAMASNGDSPGMSLKDWQGVRAPDFTVTTLDGKAIKLSDLRGKRVVLDFWATWCPPLREGNPAFYPARQRSRGEGPGDRGY
jgi:thiol:disulfide interchange protein